MSTNFNVMMARLRASDSPFLAEVAAEMGRMNTDNAELRETIHQLRDSIRQMNLRSIINTQSVQVFGKIEQTIDRVRTLDLNPITAINQIDDLVQAVNEEAKQ